MLQDRRLLHAKAPTFLSMAPNTIGAVLLGSSGIASLLNQGANDSILDDVAGLFLGGLSGGGSRGGGGILGSLLGGLMGSNCRSCNRKLESDFKYCPECGNRR